jgi:hypothetical protein
VLEGWKRLHNVESHNLYAATNIIRVIRSRRLRWEGHVARMGEKKDTYKIFVGKAEKMRPLQRPSRR